MELDQELTEVMVAMYARVKSERVSYLTMQYLLWALAERSETINKAFFLFDINKKELLEVVEKCLAEEKVDMPLKPDTAEPIPSVGLRRVIVNANTIVKQDGQETISCLGVLEALIREEDSNASRILRSFELTADAVKEYRQTLQVENKTWWDDRPDYLKGEDGDLFPETLEELAEEYEGIPDEELDDPRADPDFIPPTAPARADKDKSMLELYATNLNEEVKAGRIDPIIGREQEVERVMQVICRRRKNNALLVGDAGVGKTAIGEGLAYRIVHKKVPGVLADYVIYSLDIGGMVAGTRYRGDFEERIKKLIKEIEAKPKVILFIDEIHQILGAGSTEASNGDAATMLKPSLAKGTIKVIGTTTYEELRKFLNKDAALLRRFQKIDIEEPSQEDAIKILDGLKAKFEEHHRVKYHAEAIRAAVELSSRYITDRKLPDKAIDVVDEAGARKRFLLGDTNAVITKAEIEAIVSKFARIPPQTVNTDDKKRLKTLAATLKKVIFGQDEAIDAVADAIKLSRSGLGKVDRPIGSFLFTGPTGVGKTELARQLAKAMGVELIRFDMSEYLERFNVSRLIGAPPGYVGYDQGGQLTEAITKHPHSVLLMDEIEKAHPDIYNILLQVMDHGALTDNNGKVTDFRNVILIMTTNAGSRHLSQASIGFVTANHYGDENAEITKTFTPEFRNRLDSIISFKPLGTEQIKMVVDKLLAEVGDQLKQKGVEATFGEKLKAYLAKKGFDPQMGARPMQRLIQNTVRKALADELLFGNLTKGGRVTVDLSDSGEVFLDVTKKPAARKKKAAPSDTALKPSK